MNDRRLAAALGFAFVAAWIAFTFGYALLCLLGAAIFWAVASVLDGNLDLGDLQARLTNRDDNPTAAPPTCPRESPMTDRQPPVPSSAPRRATTSARTRALHIHPRPHLGRHADFA